MRRLIPTFVLSLALTVLAMNGFVVSQRIDGTGQQAIAGPHAPAEPMTVN